MKNTIRYSLVNSGYWMTFCAIYGYANYYMLNRGFLSNEIGMVVAAGNLLAFFIQPLLATFADRSRKYELSQIIIALSSAIVILSLVLMVNPDKQCNYRPGICTDDYHAVRLAAACQFHQWKI